MTWPRVSLGEVMHLDVETEQVNPSGSYPIVGVLNRGRGLLYRAPISGSETAYAALNRVRAGQVVYSRLKAFEGSITVVPENDSPAFASPEFPTFTCGPALLPAYFALLTTVPTFWGDLQRLSTGMGGRRERVKPTAFLTIEVALPTIPEQARIVDMMKAVDRFIECLAVEISASEQLLVTARDELMNHDDWPTAPLRDVTRKIGSGATPRGGQAAYVDEGVSLIRSQNVHDLNFLWAGLAHITDVQAKALDGATVEVGDVLINITGASVNRVCQVPEGALPARVNQHVAILRCDEKQVVPQFLAHALRRSDIRTRLDLLAESGSTRQAITKSQLETLEVPCPAVDAQQKALDTLNAASVHVRALNVELEAARVLRSDLTASMLSGEAKIPDTYTENVFEVA